MADYFEELGHEPTGPNGPEPETDEMHMRRLRTLAILNGIDIEIEAPEASKQAIAKLKEHKIEKDEKTEDGEDIECAVCKKVAEEGEVYKILPCKHEFHEECILLWLKKSNSCPLCRYELETDDPDYEEIRLYRAGEAQRRERVANLLDSMFT